MRLGLNLVYLHERLAGVRVYGTELAKALAAAALAKGHSVTFFVARGQLPIFQELIDELPAAARARAELEAFDFDPASKPALLFHEQLVLPVRAWRRGVTALYSFDYRSPYLFPGRKYGTILDVNFRDQPENFTWGQRVLRHVAVALTLTLCRGVSTMSEFSAQRIRRRYPRYRKPLAVVPAGITFPREPPLRTAFGGASARTAHVDGSPFILSVGTLARHKNYVRLIEAFAALARRDVKLVIAGKEGNAAGDVRAAIERCGVADRVVVTGYVDDAALEDLYRSAELFVTASEYEGFGITVLEAMQRGIPVACSRSAALPEVAGDAAILFDAGSARSIEAALARAFGDAPLRSRLSALGTERARRFTWSAAAERAMAALQ